MQVSSSQLVNFAEIDYHYQKRGISLTLSLARKKPPNSCKTGGV
jgi:hypothetical protein